MEQVVGVGRIVVCGPLLRLWAFVREHVIAVFGLVVHAVETCYLQDNKEIISSQAKKKILHNHEFFVISLFTVSLNNLGESSGYGS